MSVPAVERTTQQVPSEVGSERAQPLQWAVSAGLIVFEALSIHPLGWRGRGLLVGVLLVVNAVILLSRHVPSTIIPAGNRLAILGLGLVAAAALMGVDEHGSAYLFAFWLTGHAGFRLELMPAVATAVASSVLCGGVLLAQHGTQDGIWLVGAATGLSVVLGLISRSQQQALDSAVQAARSAERALEAEARNAVLAERARIARDVHDVLAHSLAGINMQLELVDALLDIGDLDRVREATGQAQRLVQESLKQARWTVSALREDALPLPQTLSAMLLSSGVEESLAVTGTVRDIAVAPTQSLLRISQEALTNAARHAPGAAVHVSLHYDPETITVQVANERPAQSSTSQVGGGLGLVGMRERVALLGGTLTAGPITDGSGGGGWAVTAVVPA